MAREEQIILAIQKFLNAVDQTDSPEYSDLAEQYSEVCSDLNTRLERCDDYLKKNMIAEAINYAEMDPPILEIAAKLNFPERDEWGEFCTMYNWLVPQDIQTGTVEMLNEAYADNLALKPLQDEYRRKIRQGSIDEKIALLRRIRSIDVATTSTEEDLVRLENEKIKELKDAAKQAIQNRDEVALGNIYQELSAPVWTIQIEAHVLSKIEGELKQYRIESLRRRGEHILQEISDAYGTLDADSLDIALAKWEMLLNDDDFNPETPDLVQVEEAVEWLNEQGKERAKQKAFDDLAKNMHQALDDRKDESFIDNLYYKLKGFDQEIPESLNKRYQQSKAESFLNKSRKFKKQIAATVLIIMAVIGALAFGTYKYNEYKIHQDWAGRIGKSIKSKQLRASQELLAELEKSNEKVFNKPDIIAYREELSKMLSEHKQKKNRFSELQKELEEIQRSHFKTNKPVDEMIKEAVSLCQDDGARSFVNKIKNAKAAWDSKIQQARDNKFIDEAQKLENLYLALEAIDPEIQTGYFRKGLAGLEKGFNDLASFTGVSKELYDANITKYRKIVESSQKRLVDAEKRNQNRATELERIFSQVTPLLHYKVRLRTYLEKFPNDRSASKFRRVLRNMRAYENAVELKNFSGAADDSLKYKAFIEKNKHSNIWYKDLGRFIRQDAALKEKTVSLRQNLKKLNSADIFKYYCLQFTGQNGKLLEFYSINPFKVRISKINNEKVATVSGKIFKDFRGDKTSLHIFSEEENGWKIEAEKSTLYTDIKLLTPYDNLAKPKSPHAMFLNELNSQITNTDDDTLEMFLVDKIEVLKNSANMNDFMRCILLDLILQKLQLIADELKPSYQKALAKLTKYKDQPEDFDLMYMNDSTLIELKQKINEIPNFKTAALKEHIRRKICRLALSRKLIEVGIVRDIEGEPTIDLKRKLFKELWVLRQVSDEKWGFFLIGYNNQNKAELFEDTQKQLFEGQPVFSPQDNINTKDLARSLIIDAKNKHVEIEWPEAWPLNVR